MVQYLVLRSRDKNIVNLIKCPEDKRKRKEKKWNGMELVTLDKKKSCFIAFFFATFCTCVFFWETTRVILSTGIRACTTV
jgi:hypothetical protein